MSEIIRLGGYFTWMMFLFDKSSQELEARVGYAPTSLAAGWRLLSPRYPIEADTIDLRGSTRWPDGVMPDGRAIGSVIAERSDVNASRRKIATFLDRGLERRAAKILPVSGKPSSYPPAKPVGIPQFKLFRAIEWVVLHDIGPGQMLRRSDVRI